MRSLDQWTTRHLSYARVSYRNCMAVIPTCQPLGGGIVYVCRYAPLGGVLSWPLQELLPRGLTFKSGPNPPLGPLDSGGKGALSALLSEGHLDEGITKL
jgi:hypothetical protein